MYIFLQLYVQHIPKCTGFQNKSGGSLALHLSVNCFVFSFLLKYIPNFLPEEESVKKFCPPFVIYNGRR